MKRDKVKMLRILPTNKKTDAFFYPYRRLGTVVSCGLNLIFQAFVLIVSLHLFIIGYPNAIYFAGAVTFLAILNLWVLIYE